MPCERKGERGQALVMFALMATVLIGAVALVFDIGQLYMNQRRLQNAADLAAVAGAQNRQSGFTCNLVGNAAVQDARRYATKNGVYTSSGVAEGNWHPNSNDGVVVYFPPRTGNHIGHQGYLEVRVARTVPSLFAGVFSGGSVRLQARAVAHGCGGFGDAAIIALEEDPQAIKSQGNSQSYVYGGIYSRGGIYAQSAAAAMNIVGYAYARMTVAGDNINSTGGIVTGTSNVPDMPDPKWETPPPSSAWPNAAYNSGLHVADAWGWKHILPGTYTEITVANNDHVMFHTGVYHVTGGVSGKNFKIMGVACGESNPATIADDDDPPHGLPVSFVLHDGVTFEITTDGTAKFRSAASIGGISVGNLIIRSYEDRNAVHIVGQGNISLLGTVYTPAGDTQLAGTTAGTIRGQLVTGRVTLLGGSGPAVIYDGARVPSTRRATLVE